MMSVEENMQHKFKLLRGKRKGQFVKEKVLIGREKNAEKVREYWSNLRSVQPPQPRAVSKKLFETKNDLFTNSSYINVVC